MIHKTFNILASPDRGAIIRVIEGKAAGEYTDARFARDGEMLADLLIRILPLGTFQALVKAIYARADKLKEREQL